MKYLLVYAHPEPQSFTAALSQAANEHLKQAGHTVEVTDLYAQGWEAALGTKDFEGGLRDSRYFDIFAEQSEAYQDGSFVAAIQAEQMKITNADVVILHFPVWWFSMPAIMKGWVDRVFASGFAYSPGRKFATGHFKGKRAFLCITTGSPEPFYAPNGINGPLEANLWPIHNGILAYTGFSVLPPFVAWSPAQKSPAEREQCLGEYIEYLSALERHEPLFFHGWEDYNDNQQLKAGVVAKSGIQSNRG